MLVKKNNLNIDSYKEAGVDIKAGNRLVEAIKPIAEKTKSAAVLNGIGGFGAMYELPKSLKNPVLVSGSDGVGTKLRLALEMSRHESIGIDLVAMSVNDIITQGATPLFFLDYFSCGKLNNDIATDVIKGIGKGCAIAECSLIGGETAEMPGMYKGKEYDLAGFAVGVVEKNEIITGKDITQGDVLIGLPSSGVHSNGFSMIHHILKKTDQPLSTGFGGSTLGDVLLEPTRIYVKSILDLKTQITIKGLAHITGGGLIENLPRILPKDLCAEIDLKSWEVPNIFHWISKNGGVEQTEMLRIFNCGVGMVVVVSRQDVDTALTALSSHESTPFVIGDIMTKPDRKSQLRFRD